MELWRLSSGEELRSPPRLGQGQTLLQEAQNVVIAAIHAGDEIRAAGVAHLLERTVHAVHP
jgi:hypothetical protein